MSHYLLYILFTVLQVSFHQIDNQFVDLVKNVFFRIRFGSVILEILTNAFRDTKVSKIHVLVCLT